MGSLGNRSFKDVLAIRMYIAKPLHLYNPLILLLLVDVSLKTELLHATIIAKWPNQYQNHT